MRELEKKRDEGMMERKDEKEKEEEIFRKQKQEITGHRRVSSQPPWKNGILISILSDTGKNEAPVELGWREKKSVCPGSFPIGDPSACKQIKGNDALPLAKQTSTSVLNNRICKQRVRFFIRRENFSTLT